MRSRWLFLPLFAAFSMPGRFEAAFLLAHGQNETQVGFLIALPLLFGLLTGPLLCNVADRLQCRELIAGIAHAAHTITFFGHILALPVLNFVSDERRFSYLMVVRLVSTGLQAGILPLVCAIALDQLNDEYGSKGHERFGEERLWGAVTWAIGAILLGFILDQPNVGVAPIYIGLSLSSLSFILALWFFRRQRISEETLCDAVKDIFTRKEDEHANESSSSSNMESENEQSKEEDVEQEPATIRRVLNHMFLVGGMESILFFNLFFWLAVGTGVVGNLLVLLLEEDMHTKFIVCGVTVVITVVFEIPFFAYARNMLQKVGAPGMLCIGASCYIVRSFAYSVARSPWTILLVEPLHGVTFGASATSGVVFVAERTPPKLKATGQSVLEGIQSLGGVLGTAAGGFIMQVFGSGVLYRLTATATLIATVTFAVSSKTNSTSGEKLMNIHKDPEKTILMDEEPETPEEDV